MTAYDLDDIERAAWTATYTVHCRDCAKALPRTHEVSRYLSGAQTYEELVEEVKAQAELEAEALAYDEVAYCRRCQNDGPKRLLIEMAAEPEKVFPTPDEYTASAMKVLVNRGHAEKAYMRCSCGAPCCGGWRNLDGYKASWKGLRHAKKYKTTPAAKAP